MLTDEYKLDFSVTVFFVPLFSHIRILCKIELLLFLWECKEGVDTMCKLMEDYADKRAKSIAVELWKDGIRDIEKIAKLTKLPLDEVKKLFEGKSA